MKLTGDKEGIEVLKRFKEEKPNYLKFLLQSAKTNFDRRANFKDSNGIEYSLIYNPVKAEFLVKKGKDV